MSIAVPRPRAQGLRQVFLYKPGQLGLDLPRSRFPFFRITLPFEICKKTECDIVKQLKPKR